MGEGGGVGREGVDNSTHNNYCIMVNYTLYPLTSSAFKQNFVI